jgi:hypothetical protein
MDRTLQRRKKICPAFQDEASKESTMIKKKEEIEDLKEFLKTPIYSGEKVSDYFKYVDFNLELKGRKRKTSTPVPS